MSRPFLTYDAVDIAAHYDAGRPLGSEFIQETFALAAELKLNVNTVVDAGSGTGRFTTALADHFSAQATGIELSEAMRKVAIRNNDRDDVQFQPGNLEKIPLADAYCELVFMSQVYHHIQDRQAVAQELFRILKPGGGFLMRSAMMENMEDYLYVHEFPEAVDVNKEYLPTTKQVASTMQGAGFLSIRARRLKQLAANNAKEYFKKIESRTYSDLLLIDDVAFQMGLDRLKKKLDRMPADAPIYDCITLLLFQKPDPQ